MYIWVWLCVSLRAFDIIMWKYWARGGINHNHIPNTSGCPQLYVRTHKQIHTTHRWTVIWAMHHPIIIQPFRIFSISHGFTIIALQWRKKAAHERKGEEKKASINITVAAAAAANSIRLIRAPYSHCRRRRCCRWKIWMVQLIVPEILSKSFR